jgi:hypothetical protein
MQFDPFGKLLNMRAAHYQLVRLLFATPAENGFVFLHACLTMLISNSCRKDSNGSSATT